jgi:methylenetetrahydrofolate reductase (NADPH)
MVALRGDLPSGTATAGDFRYANELIEFIRRTQGDDWFIEVAAYPEYHPQQRYARRDLEHFANKVKAGANSAITQFFFNPDAYFHFVDEVRALGVTCPSCRASCPSTTTRASRSSRSATASRSRAGWR